MAAVTEHAKANERAAKRRHYALNKAAYIARAVAQRETLKLEVDLLKAAPCADCTVSYPAYVMDFDHVRGVKLGNVSRMIFTHSRKAVLAEIEKCDVVCANCHRVRTHERIEQG